METAAAVLSKVFPGKLVVPLTIAGGGIKPDDIPRSLANALVVQFREGNITTASVTQKIQSLPTQSLKDWYHLTECCQSHLFVSII